MTFQNLIDYVLEMSGRIPPDTKVVIAREGSLTDYGEAYEVYNPLDSIKYEDGEIVLRGE